MSIASKIWKVTRFANEQAIHKSQSHFLFHFAVNAILSSLKNYMRWVRLHGIRNGCSLANLNPIRSLSVVRITHVNCQIICFLPVSPRQTTKPIYFSFRETWTWHSTIIIQQMWIFFFIFFSPFEIRRQSSDRDSVCAIVNGFFVCLFALIIIEIFP